MPRGKEGIRQASAESQSKRGAGGTFFKLAADQETIVRFLEQGEDIAWCMVHDVQVAGRQWPKQVVCLDQEKEGVPCPGCERDLKRSFKGFINVIWKDAPVLVRDSNNRIVKDSNNRPVTQGTATQTAIWSSGIRLFENLDEVDANYRGLMSRRFRVKRKGVDLPNYVITPEDVDSGAQELSAEEKKLAEGKTDLTPFITPGSYEDFLKELGEVPASVGHGGGNGNSETPAATAQRKNPFMRNDA